MGAPRKWRVETHCDPFSPSTPPCAVPLTAVDHGVTAEGYGSDGTNDYYQVKNVGNRQSASHAMHAYL